MKLTPSQQKRIMQQKRILMQVHPNCTFNIYQPNNTKIVRLVAMWECKNVLGGNIPQSQAWTVGKRGGLKETEEVKLAS